MVTGIDGISTSGFNGAVDGSGLEGPNDGLLNQTDSSVAKVIKL